VVGGSPEFFRPCGSRGTRVRSRYDIVCPHSAQFMAAPWTLALGRLPARVVGVCDPALAVAPGTRRPKRRYST